MRKVRLSWNMTSKGVVAIFAHDGSDRVFLLAYCYRQPLLDRGEMTTQEARAFQAFAAERICEAWNNDETAAEIAESHIIDTTRELSEWGLGYNAACEQIAYAIRQRIKF